MANGEELKLQVDHYFDHYRLWVDPLPPQADTASYAIPNSGATPR